MSLFTSPRTASAPRSSVLARLALGAAATLVLAAQPNPAAAAPPTQQRTEVAMAGWFHQDQPEDGSVWTDTLLQLTRVNGAATVCLDITKYSAPPATTEPISYEHGCTDLSEGAYSIDAKALSGATLSATTVTVEQLACDKEGCVVIGTPRPVSVSSTTWTGVGSISTFTNKGKSTFGGCTFIGSAKGSFRQATVALAVEDNAFLGTSDSRMKFSCK
jgi:hypothetical protein